MGRLHADDAVQRRRNPAGAAGIGADGQLRGALRHRNGTARGGAARDSRRVERVAGRAEGAVEADAGEGELAHIGLADDHGAGLAQACDDRRVLRRGRCALEQAGAGPGRLAANVEQVLDRDDRPVERAQLKTGLAPAVGSVGLGARRLGEEAGEDGTAVADPAENGFELVAGAA